MNSAQWNTELNRIVMVIGESGVGKSTIVNMLYNQDTTDDCCNQPCDVGCTAASVTKQASFHINMRSRWCFVDTIGIGDPEMDKHELLHALRSVVWHTLRGLDCVTLVLKMGRVPQASRANVALLKKLFEAHDLKTQGLFVLTHWDGEMGDEEKDIEEWIGEVKRSKRLYRALRWLS